MMPDRVSQLFHQALGLPPDERGAFLDGVCAGDTALRAELESLLRYDASAFLETPVGAAVAGRSRGTTMVNRQLGVYSKAKGKSTEKITGVARVWE